MRVTLRFSVIDLFSVAVQEFASSPPHQKSMREGTVTETEGGQRSNKTGLMENLIRSWREVTPYFMLQVWKYAGAGGCWNLKSRVIPKNSKTGETLYLFSSAKRRCFTLEAFKNITKLMEFFICKAAAAFSGMSRFRQKKKLHSLFKGCSEDLWSTVICLHALVDMLVQK